MKFKQKKLLALVISFAMIVSVIPTSAFANEEEVVVSEKVATLSATADDGMDNDELFEMYAQKTLYPSNRKMARASNISGNMLPSGSAMKKMYTDIKPKLIEVANGKITSTKFTLKGSNYGLGWSKSQLGCEIVNGNKLTDAASKAIAKKFAAQIDVNKLLQTFLADCPYELYWFDKTQGGMEIEYNISYNSTNVYVTDVFVYFTVAKDYRGSNKYTTNQKKTGAATKAASNAKAIVAAYKDKTDWQKLEAYGAKICQLVSYDDTAAGDITMDYGDPWQLINVFDNDPKTNVVCEGYSKAFKYLCDLSDFTEGTKCYCVTGNMIALDTNINVEHMWNVVKINGQNYLVDVTNCDEGTIGQGTGLFMKTASGAYRNHKDHVVNLEDVKVKYSYFDEQYGLYENGYPCICKVVGHAHSYGGWQSDTNYHWKSCSCGSITGYKKHTASDWKTSLSSSNPTRYKQCTVCGKILQRESLFTLKSVSAYLYGYDDFKISWSSTSNGGYNGGYKVKYKVQYKKSGGKWYNVSSGTTGKSITKKNLADGAKYAFKVTPYITVNGKNYYGTAKSTSYVYTLKKVSKPTVKKSSKNYVKVSWKNIAGDSGYQVYRSKYKNKKFTKVKTVSSKYTYAKVKTPRKKNYYYKVRAYKKTKVNGKYVTVYGPWSSVKSYKLK